MSTAVKEMQHKRQSLYHQMKALNDNVPRNRCFTGEERQKWDRMENAYDANLKTLQSTLKAGGRGLEAMAAGTPAPRVSRLIGRDGGKLSTGPRNQQNFAGPLSNKSPREVHALAMQGWLRTKARKGAVDQSHDMAARTCGISLSKHSIYFDTPSTKVFHQIRAERQQKIERQLIEPRAAMSGTLGTSGGNLIGETLVWLI